MECPEREAWGRNVDIVNMEDRAPAAASVQPICRFIAPYTSAAPYTSTSKLLICCYGRNPFSSAPAILKQWESRRCVR